MTLLTRLGLLIGMMVVIFACSIATAQSYYDDIKTAESFLTRGLFAESANAYDHAFRTMTTAQATDYYNAACANSLAGNTDKALKYLRLAFATSKQNARTVVTADYLAGDHDLDPIRNHELFRSLVRELFSPVEATYVLEKDIAERDLWQLVNDRVKAGQRRVRISNKIIYWKKENGKYILNDRRVFRSDPLTETENVTLEFHDCTFEYALILGKGFGNLKMDHLAFDRCIFKHDAGLVQLSLEKPIAFRQCEINGMYLSANMSKASRDINYNNPAVVFDSCLIRSTRILLDFYSEYPLDVKISGTTITDSVRFYLKGNDLGDVQLTGLNAPTAFIEVRSLQLNTLDVMSSVVGTLCLRETEITSRFNFKQTIVKDRLLLESSTFDANPSNEVRWATFADGKLGMINGYRFIVTDTIDGDGYQKPNVISGQRQEVEDDDQFASLLGVFSLFLNQYRANNDLESYNKCFIEIKELQSRRLAYLYEKNGGFEAFFRWKLSQLLRFYVRYGTDPARAILISIYIIIVFGIFYFFFPSDWDTTSKSVLIERYRVLIEKNDKGYVKPFFQLLKGFFVSLINAVTLSLNAFITLGFGNIPTHGVARYFCVLEGFIGWFLLSIFTVALINQTL